MKRNFIFPSVSKTLGIAFLIAMLHVPYKATATDEVLIDQSGAEFSLSQLKGRYVLLYFGFLNCPDICPIELNTIAQTVNSLGNDTVVGTFVTLDPARDSKELIGEFVRYFHPEFIGLTGSPEAIRALASKYNIRYQIHFEDGATEYTVDHSIHIIVIDREGEIAAISPYGATPVHLTELVKGLEKKDN